MRYTVFLFALTALILSACEHPVSEIQMEKFVKLYGNEFMDEARDIEVLEDGSYAICGIDSIPGVGKQMILVITDEYGNMKTGFPKYFTEGALNSGANALLAKRGGQGGFLLCGYLERPVEGSVRTQRDLFLVRISSTGQELWKKSYGSIEDETILHVAERISSGFMLAGYQIRDGQRDIMVMGVTEEGDSVELSFNYNNPYADNASANYILNTGDRYLCLCTYDRIAGDGTDILILNFDDQLSPNIKILDGSEDEYARAIVQQSDESFLLLGNRVSQSGKEEIVLYSVETNGSLVTSSNQITTLTDASGNLHSSRMLKMPDGRIAIVGTREAGGETGMFLQFLSSGFQEGDRLFYNGPGTQTGVDIALPGDDGILLLGTNTQESNSMIALMKTDEKGGL
ncbi:MAG: hypothetical protein R2751_14195 [Bacteroidales bacterium]